MKAFTFRYIDRDKPGSDGSQSERRIGGFRAQHLLDVDRIDDERLRAFDYFDFDAGWRDAGGWIERPIGDFLHDFIHQHVRSGL